MILKLAVNISCSGIIPLAMMELPVGRSPHAEGESFRKAQEVMRDPCYIGTGSRGSHEGEGKEELLYCISLFASESWVPTRLSEARGPRLSLVSCGLRLKPTVVGLGLGGVLLVSPHHTV